MENQKEIENPDLMKIGIGTKDTASLEAKKVKIIGIRIEEVGTKKTKKLVCICKHPDRDDQIEISSVRYLKNNQLRTSGLWVHLDEDNLLPKSSALALFLSYSNAKNIESLEGKELPTDLDSAGYLCFKSY